MYERLHVEVQPEEKGVRDGCTCDDRIVTKEVFPLMNAPSNAKISLRVALSPLRVVRA